jgi:hypothetical protein
MINNDWKEKHWSFLLLILKGSLSRKNHQGLLSFFIEEVDQSDCIEELPLSIFDNHLFGITLTNAYG